MLLLNPFFFSETETETNAGVAVYIDNSESISIIKNTYNGINTAFQTTNDFINSLDEDLDLTLYSFDTGVQGPLNLDSLEFDGKETNLSNVMADILEQDDKMRAAVIITDGIYTFGRDPVFASSNSSIPIYIIGLGDSALVKDQSVSEIFYPSAVFSNSSDAIEIEISQNGYSGRKSRLYLYRNDELRRTIELDYLSDSQVVSESIDEEFEEPGIFQYRVEIDALDDEFSTQNNTSNFTIEVKESRVSVLDIVFEIHPDIRNIRNVLMSDQNNEVDLKSYFTRSDILEDPFDSSYDIVIIHGIPRYTLSPDIIELIRNTPTLYFAQPGSYNSSSQLTDYAEIINVSSNRITSSGLEALLTKDEQPIMELDNLEFSDYPPLITPFRSSLKSPRSIALFSGTFEGFSTNNPVISIQEDGEIRRSQVLSWNWYKWALSSNKAHRDSFRQLISNITAWTYTDNSEDLLNIVSSRDTYSTEENPILNATLVNERGDKENQAVIEINVTRNGESLGNYNMQPAGNGSYRIELPRFSEGLLEYEAIARKGNRIIDSVSGGILISNTNDELNSTLRNDEMLTRISALTGGAYSGFKNWDQISENINANRDLETFTTTEATYSFPVRNLLWFFVVLTLLITEWGIRKYYSLP
ncbi:hypothetical protein AB2B38_001415 [Balneola sp. MJW-20]|uniref:hypothetical protein n=1 Tax=Gracilimonas aurantiaca TaxID=3234185 RepID=UPI00390B8A15